MKKHNLRGKYIFGVVIALSVFFINNNVYAKTATGLDKSITVIDPQQEYCTGISDATTKSNCQKAVNICKNKLTSEVSKYKINYDLSSDNVFTYSISGQTEITKNMVVQHDGQNIASGTRFAGKFNIVKVMADLSTTQSYTGDGGTPISCTGKFDWDVYFNDNTPEQSDFENPACQTGGICSKYLSGEKTGTYKDGEITYDLDGDYSFKKLNSNGDFAAYLNKYLPYCDCSGSGKSVTDIYNDDYIKSQIVEVAKSFKVSKDIENQKIETTALPTYNSIKVDNIKQSFVCDTFSQTNERKFYKLAEPKIIKYQNTLTDKSEEVCKVQCSEEVTVNYNPPVAVKGSICFEYEIEVKSKTTCALTSTNLKPPTPPTRKKTCKMQIKCDSSKGIISTQAGPNEDFDNCVSEKFNGKYTQKAINYCYNKVYKKNNTKKVNYNYGEDIIPQKIASSNNNITVTINGQSKNINYCSYSDMKTISNITNYNEFVSALNKVADKLYSVAITTNSGQYEEYSPNKVPNYVSGAKKYFKWKANSGCYWNRYTDIYKRDKTTVYSLVYDDEIFAKNAKLSSNQNYINLRQNIYNNSGYRGNNNLARISYYTAVEGAKTAHYTNNGTTCNDECLMYTTDTNCIAPGAKDTSYDEQYKKYLVSLQNYQKALAQCQAKVECNKDTATYKMTVNHETGKIDVCDFGQTGQKGQNDSSCASWLNTKTKGTEGIEKLDKEDQILKYAKGICYNNSEKENDYHNIISFPGSWIRNKDGSVRYTKPASTTGYTVHKNEYCVSPKAGNINIDWWNWDQVYGRTEDTKSKVNTTKTKDTLGVEYNKYNGKYNIYGKMEKFGYFNWELDFSCFYAVNNNTCTGDDCSKEDEICTGTNCPKTTNGLKNSDTRTIDLSDPFPSVEGVANKTSEEEIIPKKLNNTTTEEKVTKVADSSASRTPGYNWSCDATNLNIDGYVIAPTVLTRKMQQQGEKIYDDDNELDYQLTITPEQIKSIREYNKGTDYLTYRGQNKQITFNDKNDKNKKYTIRFYQSKFLSDYTSVKRKPQAFCNNLLGSAQCDNLTQLISDENACTKVTMER